MSREHQSKSEFNYKPPAPLQTDLFAPEKTDLSTPATSQQLEHPSGGIDLTQANIDMNPEAASIMLQAEAETIDEELVQPQMAETESGQAESDEIPEELLQVIEVMSGAEQETEA